MDSGSKTSKKKKKIQDPEQPADLMTLYGHSIGEGKKSTEGRSAINQGWGKARRSKTKK